MGLIDFFYSDDNLLHIDVYIWAFYHIQIHFMNKFSVIISLAFASILQPVIAQTNKTAAVSPSLTKSKISAPAKWRGVFKIKPGVEVPFNFELVDKGTGKQNIVFLNAEERFDGGPVIKKGDSLFVKLDQFDNEFAFKIHKDSLSGFLRKQDGTGIPLAVVAEPGKNYRFQASNKAPAGNIAGKYDVVFKGQDGDDEKAVGVFKQEGNKITGTFLRITGDSRYLEGIVDGNNFYLSSFIGLSPAFFSGTFSKDGSLAGDVISVRGNQPFTAVPNENAALPDANNLTFLKEGYKTLDFSFPDVNGKKVSLRDGKYKNKVVILTITGTWCPNCVDEASFIAPWYKENRNRGVEVIGIHYEKRAEPEYVKKVLGRFRERFDIKYDQVIAGTTAKKDIAESLPALKNFISFPTTIIINKKGEVANIHTGYSGPATGKYYTDFVEEFNKEIDELLKQ
jgi:thiol-disulfide isomerase/thioredoxin